MTEQSHHTLLKNEIAYIILLTLFSIFDVVKHNVIQRAPISIVRKSRNINLLYIHQYSSISKQSLR